MVEFILFIFVMCFISFLIISGIIYIGFMLFKVARKLCLSLIFLRVSILRKYIAKFFDTLKNSYFHKKFFHNR
ncbi:MAG: hypothetical protein C0173_00730 [Desulfurella sp.]|nr:MAG: hypothetical protein C0173_00730 [Desulfurella sp.]